MACVDNDKLDGGGNLLSWSTQTESWPVSTKINWNVDRILLSLSTQTESWPVSTKINWNVDKIYYIGRHKQNHGLCRPR